MGCDEKNHYQACKSSKRNLPFPEFGYMIKLHMLEHTKPTFQMKQIHNSEKEKMKPKQKPMTGKTIFLHSWSYSPMVQQSKMSYYPYTRVILHVMVIGKRLPFPFFHTAEKTGCTTEAATVPWNVGYLPLLDTGYQCWRTHALTQHGSSYIL